MNNLSKLYARLDLLSNVYAYSLQNRRLNNGKRICITQERVSLLRVIEKPDTELRYQLPPHLESEVQKIANTIEATNWQKPIFEPFF